MEQSWDNIKCHYKEINNIITYYCKKTKCNILYWEWYFNLKHIQQNMVSFIFCKSKLVTLHVNNKNFGFCLLKKGIFLCLTFWLLSTEEKNFFFSIIICFYLKAINTLPLHEQCYTIRRKLCIQQIVIYVRWWAHNKLYQIYI